MRTAIASHLKKITVAKEKRITKIKARLSVASNLLKLLSKIFREDVKNKQIINAEKDTNNHTYQYIILVGNVQPQVA